ncbi:MAG TPA: hypothetical protein PJ982_08275 [Lacipirellulaceae bacterium]|nr:hypothetical protein [Lacipirellulaceae bacterium]
MRPPFVALLVLLFPLTNARAREVEPSDEDRALVARVATAIIAQADPVEGWAWPPLAYIVNYQGSGIDKDRDGEIDADEVNANAMLRYVRPGEEVTFDDDVNATRIELPDLPTIAGEIDADGEVAQPVIRIYQGWLTVIAQGQDALLANCFGHELAHVVLKHVGESEPGAPIVENAIQRRQEADADLLGFQLAVAAGYPVEKLLDSLTREREVLYLYSDIEAYRYRHPGHATRVALVDEHRVEVWRSLCSFANGI